MQWNNRIFPFCLIVSKDDFAVHDLVACAMCAVHVFKPCSFLFSASQTFCIYCSFIWIGDMMIITAGFCFRLSIPYRAHTHFLPSLVTFLLILFIIPLSSFRSLSLWIFLCSLMVTIVAHSPTKPHYRCMCRPIAKFLSDVSHSKFFFLKRRNKQQNICLHYYYNK